jgi:hypothetical protein
MFFQLATLLHCSLSLAFVSSRLCLNPKEEPATAPIAIPKPISRRVVGEGITTTDGQKDKIDIYMNLDNSPNTTLN